MKFLPKLVACAALTLFSFQSFCQDQNPFQGRIVYNDGTEKTGTILWHRQQDLIVVFGESGMHSLRSSQAQTLVLQDARFGTERTFLRGKNLHMPEVRGLAELVATSTDLSVISVNPGLYLSPSALVLVRTALEGNASSQAYTREDGPAYKHSLFKIFRSFCKHHGNASGSGTEKLYLVHNTGNKKPRKITLGYAIRQAIQDKARKPLLKAVLAREGSPARTESIEAFLAVMSAQSAVITNPAESVVVAKGF